MTVQIVCSFCARHVSHHEAKAHYDEHLIAQGAPDYERPSLVAMALGMSREVDATTARHQALDEAIADLEAEIDRRVTEADPGSREQVYADGWYDAIDRLRTLRDKEPTP